MSRRALATVLLAVSLLAAPAAAEESKAPGIVMTSLGAGLLLTGTVISFTSIPFWIDGLDLDPGADGMVSSADVVDVAVATSLTLIGLGCVITGAILLPRGISRLRGVQPTALITPGGAMFGLTGTF